MIFEENISLVMKWREWKGLLKTGLMEDCESLLKDFWKVEFYGCWEVKFFINVEYLNVLKPQHNNLTFSAKLIRLNDIFSRKYLRMPRIFLFRKIYNIKIWYNFLHENF